MTSVRFEIFVDDMGAAQAFYTHLFGWTFQADESNADLQSVNYHYVQGPKTIPKGVVIRMMTRPDYSPTPGGPARGGVMTFHVDDTDNAYTWALENGGGEALPPTNYPGVGRLAYVEDGHGNIVGLLTPTPKEK